MLSFAIFALLSHGAMAAVATPAYDKLSDYLISVPANHEIVFKTPSGVNSPTSTIDIALPDFVFGSVGSADIDLHYGSITGYEHPAGIAATPAAGIWGLTISGTTITLTPPTDAATGTVPFSDYIALRIGTNAGGTHQLTNPPTSRQAQITISGLFGDYNLLGIPIVNDNQLAVTAIVLPPTIIGGGGSTVNPPIISNIQVTNLTPTSATVSWDTDKSANSSLAFGFTTAYASGTVSNSAYVTHHTFDIFGLTPDTVYHYKLTSVDLTLLSVSSDDRSFVTLTITTPPVISNVQAVSITDNSAIIVWNTDRPANSIVEYGTSTAYGQSVSQLGYVNDHAVPLSGLNIGTLYHYRVISSDVGSNSATSSDYTFTTNTDTTPPGNVTLIATPGDTVVMLDWTLPSDPDFAGTRLLRKTGTFPTNPLDGLVIYDGTSNTYLDTGLINGVTYYYGAYSYDTSHNFASGALASSTPNGAPITPPATSTPPTPPATSTPPITPPVVPPTPPVVPIIIPGPGPAPTPGALQIAAHYFSSDASIEFTPDSRGSIGVLNGSTVLVVVPVSSLGYSAASATLSIGNSLYALKPSDDGTSYSATFIAPPPGTYQALATVYFQNGTVGQAINALNSQSRGTVVVETVVGPSQQVVPQAAVQVYVQKNGIWTAYGQPQQTGDDGSYAFIVPNGRYYSEVTKEGFLKRVSDPVTVLQNVYNEKLSLIQQPVVVKPAANASLAIQATAVATNLARYTSYGIKIARGVLQSTAVQNANSIASPALLTLTLINSVSAVSLFNLLAYLQYLFTQPILLFGRRRKRKWGVVFNSLTKQPVDLAIVRLIHYESRLLMQTAVTDKYGRYRFLVKKGNYVLEVVKPGYAFPTQYLADRKEDADFLDIYHGEKLESTDELVISPNVPLDPVSAEETPERVLFQKAVRAGKHVFAFSGIPLGIIIIIITPNAINAMLLLAQIGVYVLFRRLALPTKAKNWGIAFDSATKKPVAGVIVRIFDKKFNKLLETQITDANGKYGFFVRRNIYFVTAEKAGYKKYISQDIDLSQKDEAIIDQSIQLLSVDKA